MSCTIADNLPAPAKSGSLREAVKSLRRQLQGSRSSEIRHDGKLAVDMRLRHPENWAHFLTNHAPLTIKLAQLSGVDLSHIRVVLPEKAPRFIRQAATLFGFNSIYTDGDVMGPGIVFDISSWGALRPDRVAWARTLGLSNKVNSKSGISALPKKVFIPRKDTRKLVNQAEVEDYLSRKGFVTIYPEDLPVDEQFNLLDAAECIVAVHGAGLAPLLYRREQQPMGRLIELQPCGIVSTVFRTIAEKVGCHWVGVRGKIRPEYIPSSYKLNESFLTLYCNDDFEVDIVSLKEAMKISNHTARPDLGFI